MVAKYCVAACDAGRIDMRILNMIPTLGTFSPVRRHYLFFCSVSSKILVAVLAEIGKATLLPKEPRRTDTLNFSIF